MHTCPATNAGGGLTALLGQLILLGQNKIKKRKVIEHSNLLCIIGNDMTITMAAEAGQLELNYAEPVLYHKLFESLVALAGAVETFTDNCVSGITANEERCRELVDGSVGVITAICPKVGYKESADIAKEAIKTGASVRDVLRSTKLFTDEEIERVLNNLSSFHIFPRQFLEDVSQQDVVKIFHSSIEEVLKRRPDMRDAMLSYVISLILADSSFNEQEVDFIFDIGEKAFGFSTKEVADRMAVAIQQNFIPSYEAIC